MNLQNLEAFVHVAWFGSFSKAAEMLYLTQPSISSRIQSLEKEIGSPLFERLGRHVVLTELGKFYLPYAENLVNAYRESRVAISRYEDGVTSEVTIAASLSISTYILPSLLTAFRKQYPEASIKILTGQANDILDMVLKGKVDFGLTRTILHPKIHRYPMFSDQILLVAYPEHPFSKIRTVRLEEISHEPMILFDQGSADWSVIHGLFQSEGMNPNIILSVESIEAVKQLVLRQVGLAFLPYMAVREEIEKGELIEVPICNTPRLARQIDLIESIDRSQPNPVIQDLKERLIQSEWYESHFAI